MAELRYNPLLKDWTMVSAARAKRPNLPKTGCPFCPGSGKVPENYDVYLYPNDFPVLSENPPQPDEVGGGLYRTREARGQCDVVLYSPDHQATIVDLSPSHMEKLVNLWGERFNQLEQNDHCRYVMIFENRGEEVGVTMHHPHGQIYAYPFLPLKIRVELEACRDYYEQNGRNLFDDMIAEEQRFQKRVVLENEHFLACIPFFTDYPFGVFIIAKKRHTAVNDFAKEEKRALGFMLQAVVGGMDLIYDKVFPYMMVMHQRPCRLDCRDEYRFHIEFYPPLRDKNQLKYNASSETGGWAAANPAKVEETAAVLRQKIQKYLKDGRHA